MTLLPPDATSGKPQPLAEPDIQCLLAVLPGLPAPSVGRIPDKRPAAERFVPFAQATWADLQGFLHDRTAQARWARGSAKERMQRWKADLQAKMRALAPLMAHRPTMTVLEACQWLQRPQEDSHQVYPHKEDSKHGTDG